jgi:aryl-alcohol dehydrogenase-like predicted oxidoreductase
MIPYCKFHGIGIIPWGPLSGGDLARPLGTETARSKAYEGTPLQRKYRPSDELIISRVEEIAQKKGWKMSQVALAWSAMKVTSPIIGISSVERLDDSIVTGFSLSDEEVKYLEEP